MAYQIKGGVIINDSRSLLGVNTAGITTGLFVGEDIQMDGASGIITATEFVGDGSRLTGVVTVADSGGTPEFDGDLELTGGLVVGTGLTVTAGLTSLGGNLELNGNDIEGVGTGTFQDLIVNGTSRLGTALSFSGQSAAFEYVSGITTDLNQSAGADEIITAAGVQAYVDSTVGAGNTMEFIGNTGDTGTIDLVNDTFKVEGDANEIVTNVGGVGFNTITVGLSDTLVVPGTLDVTGLTTFNDNVVYATGVAVSFADDGGSFINSIGISSNLQTDAAAESRVVSEKAIKEFVDGVSSDVTANSNLRLTIDDGDIATLALSTDDLEIRGTANEVTVAAVAGAGNTGYQIGLPDAVTITTNLTVGAAISFTGGDADEFITGITTDLTESAGASEVVTAAGILAYVDGEVTNTGTLNFVDADGTAGSVELGTQTLGILGTDGEVEVAVSAGTTQFTIGLPDNVDVDATLVVGTGMTISAGNLDFSDAGLQEITGVTSITASGRIQANDFNSTSDITKKENIVVIPDALEKVEALRGVTFDWKDGSGKSGGIIAQEVQEVLPTLVKEGDHLTVNYNGLVGLLIEAVKELSARVEELEGN